MVHSNPVPNSGNIAITIIPQANGRYICEVSPSLAGRADPTMRFHGQDPKHAVAIALENLARVFRMESEADQNIAWEAVEKSPSGKANNKCSHVILHYERIADEESKFEAMLNTQMGNTVIENADISVIQVDPDLAIEPLSKFHGQS